MCAFCDTQAKDMNKTNSKRNLALRERDFNESKLIYEDHKS